MSQLMRNNLTLAACAISPGVVLGVFLSFRIRAPDWRAAFGASLSSVMLIYSASGLLMTLSLPVVGRLLTRVPAWRLIALGAVLMGGGIVLASLLRKVKGFAPEHLLASMTPNLAILGHDATGKARLPGRPGGRRGGGHRSGGGGLYLLRRPTPAAEGA